jgi:hypothetical protein
MTAHLHRSLGGLFKSGTCAWAGDHEGNTLRLYLDVVPFRVEDHSSCQA